MKKKGIKQKTRTSPTNLFFRDLGSVLFRQKSILPKGFTRFVEEEIWPKLTPLHKGYMIEEKKQTLAQIVHALVGAGLTNRVVSDSRNYNDREARKRVPVWDALAKLNYCRVCKGSEITRKVTRYRATWQLLGLKKIWKLKFLEDLNLKRNSEEIEPTVHALVVLYGKKIDIITGKPLLGGKRKRPLSIRKHLEDMFRHGKKCYFEPEFRSVQEGLDHFRGVENLINDINNENLSHSWVAYTISELKNTVAFQPNVCLRQIHSGLFYRATRLYSWSELSGQGLSKEQRKTIKIDGEKAAEIDSHCHAIRLLYHLMGIDKRSDLYYPEKILKQFYSLRSSSTKKKSIARDFVKKCTNICLNTPSRNTALKAVSYSMRESEHSEFLKDLVFEIEETSLNGILDRLIEAHPKKVSNEFFTEIGLELMTLDGDIMLETLKKFVIKHKKPALAIHDSIVVRVSDVKAATKAFTNSYRKLTGYSPVLKRKF